MSDSGFAAVNGIYAGYFTARAGVSFGLFMFKDGVIAGADMGGATYEGEFKLVDGGQRLLGFVEFALPAGSTSITGASADAEPMVHKIPIDLPLDFQAEPFQRIETPTGPVNARFQKIRKL